MNLFNNIKGDKTLQPSCTVRYCSVIIIDFLIEFDLFADTMMSAPENILAFKKTCQCLPLPFALQQLCLCLLNEKCFHLDPLLNNNSLRFH